MSNDPLFDLAHKLGKTTDEVKQALLSVGVSLTRTWPERADGRKAHYGEGEQPWDTAKRLGWASAGAAFCVLRYLRRTKDPEHSAQSAKVYWKWLRGLARGEGVENPEHAQRVLGSLVDELTPQELNRLHDDA